MVLQGSRIDAHKADQLRSTGSTMYIGDVGIRNWNRRHSQANHNRAPPSLDTAGTEQFMALKELYMRSGQGFVLVFSLTQLGSVNELGPLREQIVRIKDKQVPIVLVGNKSDLKSERQVPREIGTNLSRAWGNVPYYEASARKRINVDEIFADIVRQCRVHEARNKAANGGRGSDKRDKKKCIVM